MRKQIHSKWLPLFVTNFLGVFNDNFLKMLVFLIAVTWLPQEEKGNAGIIRALAAAMLVVPYILFSPLAGRMSKLKNKRDIVRIAKFAEIPIMMLACLGFAIQNITLTVICIFLMGVQSALFSPAKYGLIRDIGGDKGLSFGTGTMEMLTFLGVILATVAAGLVSDHFSLPFAMPALCVIMLLIALSGWLTSCKIKVEESAVLKSCEDSINPIQFIRDSFRWAKTIKGLNYVVLGLCGFWLIGSMLQTMLLAYCGNVLKMDGFHSSMVVTASALGIGTGCYLAGVLSNHQVNLRLVLLGGVGVIATLLCIYFTNTTGWVFASLIFITGCFAGLHEVPLNAWVQKNIKGRQLGDALAYINITTFIFMSLGAVIYGCLDDSSRPDNHGTIEYLFPIMAAIVACTTILMYFRIPEMRKKNLK